MSESIDLRRPEDLIWTAWFCLCLVQLSLPAGISANYLFCLTPLVALWNGDSLRYPPASMTFLGLFFFAIYAAGILGLSGVADHALWRTASFLVFSSLFVFCVIRVTPEMIRAFMWAVVIVSIAYSAEMIFRFYLSGFMIRYNTLAGLPAAEPKDLVGTQRMAFLFGVAYWVLAYAVFDLRRLSHKLAASVGLAVVFSGILLTFSRASVVALACSFAVFMVWRVSYFLKNGLGEARETVQALALFLFANVAALALFPQTLLFYADRVLRFFLSGQAFVNVGLIEPKGRPDGLPLGYNIAETSEGTRLRIWHAILEHVEQNPLTGSGFMGMWSVSEFGSAHNQYMDVLLRTGYVGAFAYLVLLAIVTAHLFRVSKPLFFGMVTALVAGLFHETFKESHGAFLIAFFVGMYASRNPDSKTSRDDRMIPEFVAWLRDRAFPVRGSPVGLENEGLRRR